MSWRLPAWPDAAEIFALMTLFFTSSTFPGSISPTSPLPSSYLFVMSSSYITATS